MPRANVQRDRPFLGYLLLFVDHSTPIVRRLLYGNRYAWYQIRYNRRTFFRRAKHRKWMIRATSIVRRQSRLLTAGASIRSLVSFPM